MRDFQLEPNYVYENEVPEVELMICPEARAKGARICCLEEFNRPELLTHMNEFHQELYGKLDTAEAFFEDERARRYGR